MGDGYLADASHASIELTFHDTWGGQPGCNKNEQDEQPKLTKIHMSGQLEQAITMGGQTNPTKNVHGPQCTVHLRLAKTNMGP